MKSTKTQILNFLIDFMSEEEKVQMKQWNEYSKTNWNEKFPITFIRKSCKYEWIYNEQEYNEEKQFSWFDNYDDSPHPYGFVKRYDENSVPKEIEITNTSIGMKGLRKNGLKIGEWEIYYRFSSIFEFERIGGGSYNEQGQKQGRWIEFVENYSKPFFISIGYYQNDLKIGFWKIFKLDVYDFQKICQGQYNQHGVKVGLWRDFSDEYQQLKVQIINSFNQILNQVKYNDKGEKYGKQKIYYKHWPGGKKFIKIGGGKFDSKGQKFGFWKEQFGKDAFDDLFLMKGRYKSGHRFGIWNIFYQNAKTKKQMKLGEGRFEENGIKNGIWREPNREFFKMQTNILIVILKDYSKTEMHFNENQLPQLEIDDYQKVDSYNYYYITEEGKYQSGIRIGYWNILYYKASLGIFSIIGGGNYNEKGEKIGIWKVVRQKEEIQT